ncbi:hypothetical protein ACFL6S_13195 [Candidatus Poribacteria bacterium]
MEFLITIYSTIDDGEIIIIYDSRWQYPELLGYKPEDPQYKLLRKLWEEATEETIPDETTVDEVAEALQPEN